MTDPLKRRAGLIPGGRGGPENELLEDGQEEVFSRTEVESGRIEHQAETVPVSYQRRIRGKAKGPGVVTGADGRP